MFRCRPIPVFDARAIARFWSLADRSAGDLSCWPWTGSTGKLKGYGYFRFLYAHRVAFTIAKGQIGDGLSIDHLCRNRRCVNPAHLEAVSGRLNTLRGAGPSALHARKTHCVHGHEFTADNLTRVGIQAGTRICATCVRRMARDRMRRIRADARNIAFTNEVFRP